MSTPIESQEGVCKNCRQPIVWHFDTSIETDEASSEYGFWYNAEHLTEVCGGVDGDPDEDLWHEPEGLA